MQIQATDHSVENAPVVEATEMKTLSSILASDYEGDVFTIVQEHAYGDEVVTIGDGQWADEEMYAFLNPRPAALHVLNLVEEGHLERILRESDEMEGVTLSVAAAYVIEHTISPVDEFVTVTLDRDDGYQVDLSFEAQVMVDVKTREGLMSFDGKRSYHGRSL